MQRPRLQKTGSLKKVISIQTILFRLEGALLSLMRHSATTKQAASITEYIIKVFLKPSAANILYIRSVARAPPSDMMHDCLTPEKGELLVPKEQPATTTPMANARYFKNHCAGKDTYAVRVSWRSLQSWQSSGAYHKREDQRIRNALEQTLWTTVRLLYEICNMIMHTWVMKNCHSSVQNAEPSIPASQNTAPSARKGYQGSIYTLSLQRRRQSHLKTATHMVSMCEDPVLDALTNDLLFSL